MRELENPTPCSVKHIENYTACLHEFFKFIDPTFFRSLKIKQMSHFDLFNLQIINIVFIRLRTLALIKVGERSIKAVWIIRISAYGGMKSGKSAI